MKIYFIIIILVILTSTKDDDTKSQKHFQKTFKNKSWKRELEDSDDEESNVNNEMKVDNKNTKSPQMKCFNFGELGHHINDCPKPRDKKMLLCTRIRKLVTRIS